MHAGPDLPTNLAVRIPLTVHVDVSSARPQDPQESLKVACLQTLLGDGADVLARYGAPHGAGALGTIARAVSSAQEHNDRPAYAPLREMDVRGGGSTGEIRVIELVLQRVAAGAHPGRKSSGGPAKYRRHLLKTGQMRTELAGTHARPQPRDAVAQAFIVGPAVTPRSASAGRSTVSGIVAALQESGLVVSAGTALSTGGRKPDLLALAENAFFAVGIKIEPQHVRAALTDLRGAVIAESVTSLHGKESDHVLAGLRTVYDELTVRLPSSSVLGVGIALPGLVDPAAGLSIDPHFFRWRNLPLRDAAEKMWQLPVWVENDARAGALGEKWALSSDADPSFLFVTVGVGIGAGIVLKGELMEGGLVGAGHLGHTTVVLDGLPCHCGLRGCLETVANDAALLRAANAGSHTRYDSVTQVFQAARAGDGAARAAIEQAASYLALSIANVVKVTGISRVVLGGESAVAGGPLLVDVLRRILKDLVFAETREQVVVQPSRLGNAVWQVGAAALVLEALYTPPIYATTNPVLERVMGYAPS